MDELKFRDKEEFLEQFFNKPEEIIRSVARSELQNMAIPKRKKGICSVIRRMILILAAVISLSLGVFFLPQNLTVTTYSSQNVPHTIISGSAYKPIWHEYRKYSEEGDALYKNQIDTKRLCIEFVTLGIVTGLLCLIFKE
ncbi:MAG: hypothetical protein GX796_05295 [Clostridiaceae bacterium]|nr:hypothetical protein [Clostridiaceae bacterium]